MADVECFSSSDADAEPIDIPGCKFTLVALTARTPRSLPVSHSQHGDLPRSIPCPGGLLLLQHDSQYVSLPPVLPCSADSVIPTPSFRFPHIAIGARSAATPPGYEARLGSAGDHDLVVRSVGSKRAQASPTRDPPLTVAVSPSGDDREGEAQGALPVSPG